MTEYNCSCVLYGTLARDSGSFWTNKRGRQVETFNRAGTHDSTQLESDKNASRNANRESRQGVMTETQRSTDGMLFYTPLSLQRLHAQLQTSYYWQREPFGDG